MSIRIGIAGYGNLGRGVECAVKHNPDMELKAVFTRRDPASVSILTPGVPVYSMEKAVEMENEIDVLILCGAEKVFQLCKFHFILRLFRHGDAYIKTITRNISFSY